jgi:hypothetical protein
MILLAVLGTVRYACGLRNQLRLLLIDVYTKSCTQLFERSSARDRFPYCIAPYLYWANSGTQHLSAQSNLRTGAMLIDLAMEGLARTESKNERSREGFIFRESAVQVRMRNPGHVNSNWRPPYRSFDVVVGRSSPHALRIRATNQKRYTVHGRRQTQ